MPFMHNGLRAPARAATAACVPAAYRLAACVLGAAACLGTGAAAAADLFYGADAGWFWDDNVTRAQARPDILADSGLTAGGSLGLVLSARERDSFAVGAELRTRQYQRFHGLDMAGLGANVSYRMKFGLGAYAPRAAVSFAAGPERYGDSLRNGWRSRLALELGRRLNDRWDISGGYSVDRFDADNVLAPLPRFSRDVYSLQGRSLFARAEYTLSERWLALLHLNFRRGDVLSSSRPSLPVFLASSDIAPDAAFGAGYFAYKLAGRTASARLGASYALSPHSSLNLDLTREVTVSEGPLGYRSTLGNATFVYSY